MDKLNVLGKIYIVIANPIILLFSFFFCTYKIPGYYDDWWYIPSLIAIIVIHLLLGALWISIVEQDDFN